MARLDGKFPQIPKNWRSENGESLGWGNTFTVSYELTSTSLHDELNIYLLPKKGRIPAKKNFLPERFIGKQAIHADKTPMANIDKVLLILYFRSYNGFYRT